MRGRERGDRREGKIEFTASAGNHVTPMTVLPKLLSLCMKQFYNVA
jgi:hypothetical protein